MGQVILILPTCIWMWSHLARRNDKHPNDCDHTDFFLVDMMTNRTYRSPHWDEYRWEFNTCWDPTALDRPGWGQRSLALRSSNSGWCSHISAETERTQFCHSQQLLKEQIFSIHSKENYVCENRKLCGCKFSNLVIISDPFQ